jgi:hydrogenase/urease accessory protein HupE
VTESQTFRLSRRFAIVALVLVLRPAAAEAHLVTTGLGPVYDGISHVLFSPNDLVPVLTMALLAGLNGPTAGRRALFGLTGAWIAGGVAGFASGQPLVAESALAGSFLALGVLTAMDRRLSPGVVTALALVVGLVHGWLNGASLSAGPREILGLFGIVGAVFVVVAIVAGTVVSLRWEAARIVVRVAGSWVAAVGLLMVGWALRGL